ncbi:hypothetical protein C1H46_009932 [Malus baccata]|uniref:Uncharacterized protein n=1 Tax=Malus baccata TaxID=106549 RepID=A0A540N043_MALBA|nr:hypothetical protein C1H46_009932 [Malus baccata]
MADSGGPSSAKSHYRISDAELVRYKKSDMVNKFRGVVRVLVRDRCGVPDWDINKNDANVMKCIDVVFKYHFRELKFHIQPDTEQHRVAGLAED